MIVKGEILRSFAFFCLDKKVKECKLSKNDNVCNEIARKVRYNEPIVLVYGGTNDGRRIEIL